MCMQTASDSWVCQHVFDKRTVWCLRKGVLVRAKGLSLTVSFFFLLPSTWRRGKATACSELSSKGYLGV